MTAAQETPVSKFKDFNPYTVAPVSNPSDANFKGALICPAVPGLSVCMSPIEYKENLKAREANGIRSEAPAAAAPIVGFTLGQGVVIGVSALAAGMVIGHFILK